MKLCKCGSSGPFHKSGRHTDGLSSLCGRCASRLRSEYVSQEAVLYYNARRRAKAKGLPFDLSREDIEIPAVCPLLGIPLASSEGAPGPNSPSLDRKIPHLGYVKGNVWVISHRANSMKLDATIEEIELLATNLRRALRPRIVLKRAK